jgi:uncharacterized membrane protein YdcZ (DUF606 family)
MLMVMIMLGTAGILLFCGGPLLARLVRRGGDPAALARLLQIVGILLMIAALLVRPQSPATAAFPRTPDQRMIGWLGNGSAAEGLPRAR